MRRGREQAACPGARPTLSEAFARYLFKLMAYKDEYEVARLSLKTAEARDDALDSQFGAGARSSTITCSRRSLKALGLKRKIKLGRSFDLVYRGAAANCASCAAQRFDLFGYRSRPPRPSATSSRSIGDWSSRLLDRS